MTQKPQPGMNPIDPNASQSLKEDSVSSNDDGNYTTANESEVSFNHI